MFEAAQWTRQLRAAYCHNVVVSPDGQYLDRTVEIFVGMPAGVCAVALQGETLDSVAAIVFEMAAGQTFAVVVPQGKMWANLSEQVEDLFDQA